MASHKKLEFKNNYGVSPPTRRTEKSITCYRRRLELAIHDKILRQKIKDQEQLLQINNILREKAWEEAMEETPMDDPESKKTYKKDFDKLSSKLDILIAKIDNIDYRLKKVEDTTYSINFKIIRNDNFVLRINQCPFSLQNPLPFLDGSLPPDDLPKILSVQEIDLLTKNQCKKYLKGYGVAFNENDDIELKYKLRDIVGFHCHSDIPFEFRPFVS